MRAIVVPLSLLVLASCANLDGLSDAHADCSGASVDTSRDPHHCGACGHDCLGGSCVAGRCQETVLVDGLQAPHALALAPDDDTIFWTDPVTTGQTSSNGLVMACSRTRCDGPRVVASSLEGPWAIAVDVDNVYFTTLAGNGVVQCPRAGCAGGTTVLFLLPPPAPSGLPFVPRAIAVHGGFVYWTIESSGSVYRCAVGGCPRGPTMLGATASGSGAKVAWGLAVDDASAYWVQGDGVYGCPTAGCAPSPGLVASLTPSPTALPGPMTQTDSALFWVVDGPKGTVTEVAKSLGEPVDLATDQDHPADVATDGAFVYWTESGAGAVWRAPVGGGAPERLASGQNQPQGIAVDARAVYWTTAGAIHLLAK